MKVSRLSLMGKTIVVFLKGVQDFTKETVEEFADFIAENPDLIDSKVALLNEQVFGNDFLTKKQDQNMCSFSNGKITAFLNGLESPSTTAEVDFVGDIAMVNWS